MRLRRPVLLAALPALLVAAAPAPAAEASDVRETYVVLLHADTPDAGVARAEALGADVGHVYRYAVRGYAASLTPAALAALRDDPSVASLTPDGPVHLADTQANPPWGLDRIDQRPLPLDSGFTYGATGAGVTAYVIDTGIRLSHDEFDGRAVDGFDAVDIGTPADDCHGHGTHVAGTVGGETYGVAKAVQLVAVRVFDCTTAGQLPVVSNVATIVLGVDWVTQDHLLDPSRPAVANMSIGSAVPYPAIDAAVSGSIASGIAYAVAAGNEGMLGGACLSSPGRVGEAMTTGATRADDHASSFSNYGPCVDWYAPGSGVLSAYWTGDAATHTLSGTSMASPHTAGVAAQYLELNPLATPLQVHLAIGERVTPNVVTTREESDPPVRNPRIPVPNDDLLYTDF